MNIIHLIFMFGMKIIKPKSQSKMASSQEVFLDEL